MATTPLSALNASPLQLASLPGYVPRTAADSLLQPVSFDPTAGGITVLIAVLISLSIGYRQLKAQLHGQHIAKLEKLWQLSPSEENY